MEGPTLHVCHECEMIGSKQEAYEHSAATGHPVAELTPLQTAAVRADWNARRAERVAALITVARRGILKPAAVS